MLVCVWCDLARYVLWIFMGSVCCTWVGGGCCPPGRYCVVFRQLPSFRFGSLRYFVVSFYGLWYVYLGCDGVDGLLLGLEFVVTGGVSSVVYPLSRGLIVGRVWIPRCSGCVFLQRG